MVDLATPGIHKNNRIPLEADQHQRMMSAGKMNAFIGLFADFYDYRFSSFQMIAEQDNLSAAAREPIFNDMASIVNGDVAAEDAVAAVLEANAE